MCAYPLAPLPSIQDDKQQQAEETGHVYKESAQGGSSTLPREHYQNLDSRQAGKVVPPAPRKMDRPHLKQQDYEREVLTLLSEMTAPIPARVIIRDLERRMRGRFSEADLEPTEGTRGKSNSPRWEVTARFAIYMGLKKKGLIRAVSKNQWVITPAGREFISKTTVT